VPRTHPLARKAQLIFEMSPRAEDFSIAFQCFVDTTKGNSRVNFQIAIVHLDRVAGSASVNANGVINGHFIFDFSIFS